MIECHLPGIIVSYKSVGHGRPVLMLHGWPYDHTQMEYEMEQIFVGRSGWQRIYVDLPGMGKTQGTSRICSSDDILQVLEEFVDAVIGDRRFVIAGMSYGGYLARGLVYRRRIDIDGVLLTVPSAEYPPRRINLPPRQVVASNHFIANQARREELALFQEEDAIVTENLGAIEYARMISAVTPADYNFLSRLRERRQFSFNVDAPYEPLDAPSLVILGRQDHQVGYKKQVSFMENYSRATVVVVDGAGHYIWGEKQHLCATLASDWLDRIEEWRDESD
jgi:pimeloyl-ACP methyl ester carboxylesterase